MNRITNEQREGIVRRAVAERDAALAASAAPIPSSSKHGSDRTMKTPGYWMHETSGVLRPAVDAYLHDERLTPEHIAALRAYLRQWIEADCFHGEGVEILRQNINRLTCRESIEEWLEFALEEGIDPL